ncbi:MAG: HD domain-containing phosphohydrolase [Atribacterota bacterium]
MRGTDFIPPKAHIVVLTLAFLFHLLTISSFAQGAVLRVVLDWDYPPFTSIDENGRFVGISVDFWQQFEQKTGIKVVLVPMEWSMAHQVMLRKEAEVIDTLFYTPERDQYLDYTRPLFSITSSIYYRKNLSISSLQDLTPHVVGVKEKDALIDIALRENPSIELRFYKNYSDIIEGARKGEIQVFLMDDPPANYHLVQRKLLYEFSRVPIPVSNSVYLATWEGNDKVLAILNEGLAKFSEEEIQELSKRYLVEVEQFPPWLWKAIVFLSILASFALIVLTTFNRLLKKRVTQATSKLREQNRELEEAKKKILKTIEVVAGLPFFDMEEKDFFARILDLALEVIPKARYGSVLLFGKDGKGRLVVLRGHDERLNGFTFEKEDLLAINEAMVLKNILDPGRKFSSPENLQKLLAFSRPIAESLLVPLWWEEKLFGQLDLDIPLESTERFTETDVETMKNFARICDAFHALKTSVKREEVFLEKLLLILMKTLEYYDRYTRGHSETSARYTLKIAQALHFDSERTRKLYWSTVIHDVGKIFIPQDTLNKPGKLTDEEYHLVKLHPIKSAELILGVEGLEDIACVIRHHHERWDGMGYPDGLHGEEIPLESRIIAAVDAFEAMTSDRPYKRALSIAEAIEELKRCRGSQFDPLIVDIMVTVLTIELQKQEKPNTC